MAIDERPHDDQPVPDERSSRDGLERSRHVSMRVPIELFVRLEALAAERNESVSQAARRLLSSGLEPPGRDAFDAVISTLLSVRDQLAHERPATASPHDGRGSGRSASIRTVDILNAKTDLQRLISDVGRGEEVVITHAGAPRARLVPVTKPVDRMPRN